MQISDDSNKPARSPLFYFILLALILIALRLPTLFIEVLDADEAIYSLFARIWFEGGTPYVDCVETKPLGIYLFFGSIFWLFKQYSIVLVHAATILVVGATAYVINLIARDIYSRRAGFFAALFYIVFSTTYIPKVIATTIEPVMLLPICLQFFFWLRFERARRLIYAFASGACFSAACLFKYQAGIGVVILFAYLFFILPRFQKDFAFADRAKSFAAFLIGSAPLPLLMVWYLKSIGSWDAFVFWSFGGNLNYIQGGESAIKFAKQILTRVLPYVASTALLWILAFTQAVRAIKKLFRPSGNPAHNSLEWLILLWMLLTFIPVSTGRRFYGHYFLLLLPAMSILASAVADGLWARSGSKIKKWLFVIWIVVPAVGFSVPRYFLSDVNKAAKEDNLSDYKPLADYVEKNTVPTDRIFAWGFAPNIYWFSGRMPATRFFWSDVLTGRVTGLKHKPVADTSIYAIPESWDMLFSDLERHKPMYIIDTSPSGLHDYQDYPIEDHPKLVDYLRRNYHEETRINGNIFYRRNN